jgi:DNA-binding CsgD family transcriptional regulator
MDTIESPGERRWRVLYDLVDELSRQRNRGDALETVLAHSQNLIPGDRGVSLMKMDGEIPFCVQWPDYAAKLIPLFNKYLNRRSPFYYSRPYTIFPAVDWNAYRESEYHNEFNVPLGIRYSIGVGIRDYLWEDQYALFVHRSPHDPAFNEYDVAALGALSIPVSNIVSLISFSSEGVVGSIQRRESESGCDILSPREKEIAELICRRMTMSVIAARLAISPRTVERHALHIYEKLNVSGRRELIRLCAGGEGRSRDLRQIPVRGTQ